jgi:hypothetical protein
MDYLARSSYLLQQGKFVADIIYYYGEDTNITALFQKKSPDIPEGYNYDFVNADALINVLSVKNGKLVTPSGMSYEVLVLDENAKKMSLPVLRKIQDLVKAGAVVTGIKPEQTPSLSDNRAEFDSIVKEVWDTNKPNVTVNQPLAEVLQTKNINPDFKYAKPNSDSEVLYVHRRLPDQEIYWVNNRKDRVEEIEASFRVTGRAPEIWHADTGKIEKAAYRIEKGQTVVQLHFDPNEAYFVIFRDKAVEQSLTLPKQTETIISTIESPWNVAFQEGRGAPATAVFSALKSLSENSEPGIKYFSGTAAYKTTFKLDSITKPAKILLDLGDVKDLAEVIVNGKNLGVVWKKPFQVDISEAAMTGENTLEVRVTNTWVNRLIGDAQAGVTNKITFTTLPFYQANSPLLPAGLLGPVKLLAIEHGLAKVPVPHRAFRVSTNEK